MVVGIPIQAGRTSSLALSAELSADPRQMSKPLSNSLSMDCHAGRIDDPEKTLELDFAHAGVHMLVEKPITMTTAEEVERLAEVRRHLRNLWVLSRCQQLALHDCISRRGEACGGEHPPFLVSGTLIGSGKRMNLSDEDAV